MSSNGTTPAVPAQESDSNGAPIFRDAHRRADVLRALPNDRPRHVVVGLEHQDVMLVYLLAWATSSYSRCTGTCPFLNSSWCSWTFCQSLNSFQQPSRASSGALVLPCELEASVGCSPQCVFFLWRLSTLRQYALKKEVSTRSSHSSA